MVKIITTSLLVLGMLASWANAKCYNSEKQPHTAGDVKC